MVNFDFPLSVVDYMHRAGRTGRLGFSGSTPQVTSFLSHNKEITIMDQIKVNMMHFINFVMVYGPQLLPVVIKYFGAKIYY